MLPAAAILVLPMLVATSWGDSPSSATAKWTPNPPAWKGATLKDGTATLAADKWSHLLSPGEHSDFEVSATIVVRDPGKLKSYFGEFWSVWPDKTFGDQGWDASILLRAGEGSGYRVQLSSSLGELALVKFPTGGYVRSLPFSIPKGVPLHLTIRVLANRVTVFSGQRELFSFLDSSPLPAGKVGIGVNSGARVEFSDVKILPLRAGTIEKIPEHVPRFASRKWVGGREWVFDGGEPILLLPDPALSYINNVKLRPGVRPLLSFNSHWDVQNQGAYAEAKNDTTEVKVHGGGKELTVSWVGKHHKNRFQTRTTMKIGWNPERAAYTYDIDSELEVLPGQPFSFNYGFDFEHHTPLDPFNWQYLIFRRRDGTLNRRPVYPVDPGTQNDLETSQGLRVWHGRHNDPVPVCPAVEYQIQDPGDRKLNTAVCAAFYDTGVSFGSENLKPGRPIRVRYRYTGYPASEAARLFKEASTYNSPMLDPNHHYLFAEWPRTTFTQFAAMSDTWIYGRVPFMTGHNQRPTYELVKLSQVEHGHAMKLGPLAFGAAPLPIPESGVPSGKYALSVKAKGDNLHGPGGRIELTAMEKSGKQLLSLKHFVGAGSFGWRESGFAFDLPAGVKTLTLGLGNGGSGDVYFADADFRFIPSGAPLPTGVSSQANATPPPVSASPRGAIADYRMIEGRGLHALDFAGGPFGVLELGNLDWVTDDGKPALLFADTPRGKIAYPRVGGLELGYFGHPSYHGRGKVPVAVAGHHGKEGGTLTGFTLIARVKPAARMGKSEQGMGGDILGVGARRIILRLVGMEAPYKLQAALDNKDLITTSDAPIDANRWYQVAVTGELTPEKKWRARMYLDGKMIQQGDTMRTSGPIAIPGSVVMGTELFYFHNSFYRGLLGRTLIFDRCLADEELSTLVSNSR